MIDETKCYAATPAATLEQHITDSNIAKNDAEWWAYHEITRLREENEMLKKSLKSMLTNAPPSGPVNVATRYRFADPVWEVKARVKGNMK